MRQKLISNSSKIAAVLLLTALLALIRAFEDFLFYDPFTHYFKGEYLNMPFPSFDTMHLFWGVGIRYWLNSAISMMIIYVIFRDMRQIQFASALYFGMFVLLMTAFLTLANFADSRSNFILFYVRRFLIQPVLVLLFIPAFYYQRHISKNNNT